MANTLIFIVFLLVYILYLWVSYVLFAKYISDITNDSFIYTELLVIVPNVFLFAFVFIVGKFFNLNILLISIAVSNAGLLVAFIIWNLLGSPKVPYKAIGGWAGQNFDMKNAWYTKVSLVLSVVILIAYPIIIGVDLFGNTSLDQVRILALKSTIIFLLGMSLLALPVFINILASNFIEEDSRARYLITQFSGLIPNALFISLLFWTFNWGNLDKKVSLGNMQVSFDPLLFTILMAYFIIFLLLPYFIGIQKAKQLRNEYFEVKNEIFDKLTEAIDLATEDNIFSRLENIETVLKNKFQELAADNIAIALGLKFDDKKNIASLTKQEALIYSYYEKARKYDKRFVYYDFLNSAYLTVLDLKNNLTNETDPTKKNDMQKRYSSFFKEEKKELHDENEKKSKSNPALWIGIIGVSSPFISQIMTFIGKYLADFLKAM